MAAWRVCKSSRIFTRPSHHGERAFYFCTCVMERRGPLMRPPLRSHPPSRQSEERIHGHAHGVRTGHVCRTHENGVPINFWQSEKPIGAGVLLKTCKGCDAATITAEAGDWARFRHEARVPYCVVVGDVSGSRPNARNLYKSDLHSGPDVLQRHWCVCPRLACDRLRLMAPRPQASRDAADDDAGNDPAPTPTLRLGHAG